MEAALDLSRLLQLDFRPIDGERFPMFRLATEAMQAGGIAPAVYNAANEIAVAAFLAGRIPFLAIPRVVGHVLDRTANFEPPDLASVLGADAEGRRVAEAKVETLK